MPVTCSRCAKDYDQVISEEHRQALGCAAEADHAGVTGHYGSLDHDTLAYRWKSRPVGLTDGVICDACVNWLVASGALEAPTEQSSLDC